MDSFVIIILIVLVNFLLTIINFYYNRKNDEKTEVLSLKIKLLAKEIKRLERNI